MARLVIIRFYGIRMDLRPWCCRQKPVCFGSLCSGSSLRFFVWLATEDYWWPYARRFMMAIFLGLPYGWLVAGYGQGRGRTEALCPCCSNSCCSCNVFAPPDTQCPLEAFIFGVMLELRWRSSWHFYWLRISLAGYLDPGLGFGNANAMSQCGRL